MSVYQNLNPSHRPSQLGDVLRWAVWDKLRGRRNIRPAGAPAPVASPDLVRVCQGTDAAQATWIGHSSYLLSLAGCQLLIDPVFAARVGIWYRRHAAPGLLPDQLPPLTAILITHNHYDHMDLASLKALDGDAVEVLENLQHRIPQSNLVELQWWQSHRLGPVEVTFVPARHWSARLHMSRNSSLWGGYILQAEGITIYHAGDSAWFEGFAEIGSRFPGIDTALLPIGAYEPFWFMQNHHMTPEQAGEAFLAVGARNLVPMHFGTFQMTDEPLMEPLERLQSWWANHGPSEGQMLEPQIGGTLALD